MRITEMHITPIAIADPPLLNAGGLHAPYALRIIVELVTDDGLSGWSEVPGSEKNRAALDTARPRVLGQDPFQLNAIFASLEGLGTETERGNAPWDQGVWNHVRSAIEVACYDLMGKATGRPVVDLLGGKCRDAVPFSAYLFYKYEGAGGEFGLGLDPSATSGWPAARQRQVLSPDEVVAEAQAMVAEYGFRSVKLKGGALPPQEECDAILALREAFGPDTPLRLDPNAIWSLETAIEIGRQLEGVLEYYEDPVRTQPTMARLRKQCKIPLATNMCTTSLSHLVGSARLHSEDIILTDHHYWGGFRPMLHLAQFCHDFGRGMSMHSNSHIGISLAAMTHIAAAIPNLTYACDTHYPWQREDILVEPLLFEDGSVRVPDGPGLGVEIDREKLETLHQQYIACGLTERNDEIEMQKVNPGWTFEALRW